MNKYKELQEQIQKDYNDFPFFFAFSDKQFKEGMAKLGLKETETDKIYRMNVGGYYLRTDSKRLRDMIEKHETLKKEAIANDDGYIYDMFRYELSNHEYSYTGDLQQTLDATGYTIEEINSNPVLLSALKKACKDCLENCN